MKRFMYRKQLNAFLSSFMLMAAFWLLSTGQAKATHAMGGDLTYVCIGPNQYQVILNVYRDCNGINLGGTQRIRYRSNACNVNTSITLSRQGSPTVVTPLCPSAPDACNTSSGTYGVERHTYVGVLTLPTGCDDWELSWRLCCRNFAITTLVNGNNDAMFITAELDNTASPCNNSPVFLNIPTAFTCVNQPTFYNHGVFDPDGDSLSFSLVNCLENRNNVVEYASGFSGTNPLTTTSGVTVDAATGAITFTPNQSQVGILCVRVEEFRNGIKIGEVTRDIQFSVLNCSNSLPTVSGVTAATGGVNVVNYEVSACFNAELCFDVVATDNDNSDNLIMYWNGAIPTASFTVGTGSNPLTGTFCWTPTPADLGQSSFTVTVEDDACPLLGVNTFTYLINVIDNPNDPIVASADVQICRGETTTLTGSTTASNVAYYEWSPNLNLSNPSGASTDASPQATTTYAVTAVYADSCRSTDYVTVNVINDPIVSLNIDTTVVCSGSSVTLIASVDQAGYTFDWFNPSAASIGPGTVSGVTSTQVVSAPTSPGTYCYEVLVTDPITGCTSIEEACLVVGAPPPVVECINIYATPTGSPTAAGTQVDPTSIEEAVARAACNNTVIKLAQGTYNIDAPLDVTSFLTIEGGFDPGNLWEKSSQAGATVINRTTNNPDGFVNAQRLVALQANGAINFLLQDLTITTDDANLPGMSTYGIHLVSCADYNITRVQVNAGNAASGADGTAGIDGVDGNPGFAGADGSASPADPANGGNGAVGGPPAVFNGAGGTAGGAGANGNTSSNFRAGGAGGGGGAGGDGPNNSFAGADGGDGGGSGGFGAANASAGAGGSPAIAGGDGADGTNGTNGAAGPAGAQAAFWQPGAAAPSGTDGRGAQGGSGGGGGDGFAGSPNQSGGGGGGGGAGGQGGSGGTGGLGGGSSYGIYIFTNGANGNITDCNLSSGTAGNGGIGATGGAGGVGGAGGAGGAAGGADAEPGAAGGAGGDGGDGGTGGNGQPGETQQLVVVSGDALATADINHNFAAEPVIVVENVNCANATVQFRDDALPIGNPGAGTGVTTWDYDVNTNEANPATGVNNPDTTQYASIGRYSIGHAGFTYESFHNIAFDQAFRPDILTSANLIGQDTFQLCEGDFATFSSSRNADTIIWDFDGARPNPGNVQNVPSAQFNTPGTFFITLQLITDCCGDSPTDSVWLIVDPLPTPTGSGDVDICEGDTTNLTIAGLNPTDSVVWTPTATINVASPGSAFVWPTSTTTYTASVYHVDNNSGSPRLSCPIDVSFTVTVNDLPDVVLTPSPVVCNNDGSITATVSNSSGPFNFEWSNGTVENSVTSSTISGLPASAYFVTVTDLSNATNCQQVETVFVAPGPSQPIAFIQTSSNVSCNGDTDGQATINTASGTAPYDYVWSDGVTDLNADSTTTRTGLAPGNYCVTSTDDNGCSSVICFDIVDPDPVLINDIQAVDPVCDHGSDGALEVEGQGGTGTFTYAWSDGQINPLATGLAPGTYTLTVTDGNGCSVTNSYTLTPQNTITADLQVTDAIDCNGGTAELTVNAAGGGGTYIYTWAGGSSGAFLGSSDVETGATPGFYSVTVTDITGCTVSDTITVMEPPVLTAVSAATSNYNGQNVTCNGASDGEATVTPAGGTAPYTYLWNDPANQTTPVATGLTAGSYEVTVTDFNGCTTVSNVSLTQPTALTAATAVGNDVSCNGGNDGSVTANPTGGIAPYTYAWNDAGNQTTATATGLTAGTYDVTVTDDNGCTTTASATVNEPPVLTVAMAENNPVSCFSGADGEAEATPAGGTAPYSYLWNGGQTTAVITGLVAGTYDVTVTDDNGCTETGSIVITEPAAALAVSTTVDNNASCNGFADGQITATASDGTGPYSYQWDAAAANQTTATATGLAAGTYDVTVTDANGCTITTSETITEPAILAPTAAVSSNYNGQNISCSGAADGEATVTPVGGTAPYSYLWDAAAGNQTTQTATNLGAGSYNVTVTDANSCTATASVTLTAPAALTATTGAGSATDVSCNGGNDGTATVTAADGTAPYSYLWNDAANQTTATATGLTAGNYDVTVTDANGCSATASTTVNEPLVLTVATAENNAVSCFSGADGEAEATPAGGTAPYSYLWNGGQTTAVITGLAAATYDVTVTDANGCTETGSIVITEPAAALAVSTTVDNNASCNGFADGQITATASDGTGPYSYQWDAAAANQTTATATGLAAGTYDVTITDANGCTITTSETITEPAILAPTAAVSSNYNGQNISCSGAADGEATVTPVGGTAPYSYLWDAAAGNQTTQTATNLGAGSYNVTVTDANSCTATASVTLTAPAALTATTGAGSATDVSCNGGNDGTATVTAADGTAPYSYLWNDAANQTTATATGLTAGNYDVTVTDANGCTATASTTVNEPAVLNAGANATNDVSCFGGSDGVATAVVVGGTSPYNYLWNGGQTTASISGLTQGSYSVTVTDANGCTDGASVTIDEPAAALSANVTTDDDVSCNGFSDGQLTAAGVDGTPGYTYQWDAAAGGQTTATATGLAAGTYDVTVTDANGCTTVASGTVAQPAVLSPNAVVSSNYNGQNISCNGATDGEVTAAATGGTAPYAYQWDSSTGGQTTQTVSNLGAGSYSVTVTDVNGCTATSTVTLTAPATLTANVAAGSVDSVTCNGGNDGSATVTPVDGTAPYSYLWNDFASQTTQTATGLIAGSYNVTVTDANGCTATATATVGQPTAVNLTLTANASVSCFGGADGEAEATVSGGIAPYSYLWNSGQTTAVITGLTAGTYEVTVTDANNCTETASIGITQPINAVAASTTVDNNVSCNGLSDGQATATGTGGTAPYNYQWDIAAGSQATATATGLAAGSYDVTVTDANGCTTTTSATITQPAVLSPNGTVSSNYNGQNISCNGAADGEATVAPTGGTAPYTFQWDAAAGSQTTATATGLGAGTYVVTVTDANSCSDTASITLTAPVTLGATLGAGSIDSVSCNGGSDGSVTVTAVDGTAPYSYLWDDAAAQTTATATGLVAGTYNVTVTDANGCVATATATVNEPAVLAANIAANAAVNCFGGADGEAEATPTGGTAPYSYLWNNSATTAVITGLTAGSYEVTVTDANGCTSIENIGITQPTTALSASAAVDADVSCNGGSDAQITITANGGTPNYTYNWSSNAGGQTTATVTGLSAGTYDVTVTDANGCTVAVSGTTVAEPDSLLASTIADNNVSCNGGSDGTATASATGGTTPYSYLWSAAAQTTATITGLTAGNYTVTITDANGCSDSSTVTITEPAQAVAASASVTTNIVCGGTATGEATVTATGGTPGYTYLWDANAGNQTTQTASNLTAGPYTVTVTDVNGCQAAASVTITEPPVLDVVVDASGTSNVNCNGGSDGQVSVVASGGTPGYSFDIGNGPQASNGTFTGLSAGSYTVTVTDLNNCTDTVNITLTQPATSVSAVTTVTSSYSGGFNVSCANGNDGQAEVAASGGTGPYTYFWSASANNQTTAVATGLAPGSHSVVVTDANGCTESAIVNLTAPTTLTGTLNSTSDVSCNGGNDGQALFSANGGVGPYTFTVDTVSNTTGAFNSLPANSYTVTIADDNGCTTTIPFTINEPNTLTVQSITVTSDYNGQDISCNGAADGAATIVAAGGDGNYSFLWDNGQTTFTASGLSATNTVTVTDGNGCTTSAIVSLVEPDSVQGTIVNQTNVACNGNTTGSVEILGSGGTPNYTYDIGNGAQPNGIFSNLAANTYNVTVTDQNGCTDVVTVVITEPAALGATAAVTSDYNGQDISCNGASDGEAQVTATGGTTPYAYQWPATAGSQTTATATGLGAGTYQVTVTDANNCVTTATVTVTEPVDLSLTAVNIQNVDCNGNATGSFQVIAAGGTSPYLYSQDGVTFTSNVIYTNLVAGTYTVYVQDDNGCSDSVSVTITEPTPLAASITAQTNVSCNGGNDGSFTVEGTLGSGTAPYTYSFDGGSFTNVNTFNTLVAGSYNVIVRDANGCEVTVTATITEPTPLAVAVINTNNPSCNATNNGLIQVQGSGGTPSPTGGYEYSIDGTNFQTSNAFTGLTAGFYTITVRDANGCTETTTVQLTEPATLDVTATVTSSYAGGFDVSCFGSNDGSAVANVTGGTAPYTIVWPNAGNQTGATATNLSAGIPYTVQVTDANNCVVTTTITLTQPAQLAGSVVAQQNVSCAGGSDGSLTVQATAGTGVAPYNYDIGSGAQSNNTFSNLSVGGYAITITDANGCDVVVNATISEPPSLVVDSILVTSDYNGQDISCNGASDGSVAVFASGGTGTYTYLWSANAGNANTFSVSGLADGNYTVTVTDANGCETTANISLTEPSLLTFNAVVTQDAGCAGQSNGEIVATVNGGTGTAPYTYSLDGVTFTANNTFTNLSAGIYTVYVRDANDCESSNTVTVTESAPLSLNIVPSFNYNGEVISCNGASDGEVTVQVSGGAGGYTYLWDNGQTVPTATGLAAGTHCVTVTDINNCTDTVCVTLDDPEPVAASVTGQGDASCNGANDGFLTVAATGGVAPYSYNIGAGDQLTGTFNNLTAGAYTVTVTDENGCQTTVSTTINEPTALVVTMNSVDISCSGLDDGTAAVIVTGGTPLAGGIYNYNWSTGQSTSNIGNLSVGTYSVTVTDANGCTEVATTVINEFDPVEIDNFSSTDVSCSGLNDGTMTITAVGGSGSYDYSIDGGNTWLPMPANPFTVQNLFAGQYNVVIRDANNQSCEDVQTVIINEFEQIEAIVDTDPVSCNGDTDGEATVQVTGGSGNYLYNWSTGDTTQSISGLAPNAVDGVPTGTPYSVTVTDANGCFQVVNDVYINEPAVLEATISSSTNVACFGSGSGTATVSVTGGDEFSGYSYLWDNGETTATAVGLDAFAHVVTVTDANGCSDTAAVEITEPSQPLIVNLSTQAASCFGGNDGAILIDTIFGGSPEYEFAFNENGPYGSAAILSQGLTAGEYTVYVRDSSGCVETVSDLVVQQPGPVDLIAYQDTTIQMGGEVTLFATVNSSTVDLSNLTWSYVGEDGALVDLATGAEFLNGFTPDPALLTQDRQFIVSLGDICGTSDTVNVEVLQDQIYFIPDAFTPDNNGINDVFTVYGGTGVEQVEEFLVFDRWGELVHRAAGPFQPGTIDPAFAWDGTFQGKALNPGVFVYFVRLRYIDGTVVPYKGDVTLLK